MDGDSERRKEAARARREPRPGASQCGSLFQQMAAIKKYLATARSGRDERAWQRALRDAKGER